MLNEIQYKDIFSPSTMRLLKGKSGESLRQMFGDKSLRQAIVRNAELLPEIVEAEKNYRDMLEIIAVDIVKDAYPIIEDAGILIDAKIETDNIISGHEEEIEVEGDPNDIDEDAKRHIINGITHGAAVRGAFSFLLFREYLDVIDDSLVDKYKEVLNLTFGAYDNEEAVAFMLAMLAQGVKGEGGKVKVIIPDNKEGEEPHPLTIVARAICFPMLVHEIVKGLYEIVSLQGFGPNKEKNQQVVNRVDKLEAEPEGLQMGKFIYDALNKLFIDSNVNDPRIREYFLAELYKLPTEEFIPFVENAVKNSLTSDQQVWVKNSISAIESDLTKDDSGLEDIDEIRVEPSNKHNISFIKDKNISRQDKYDKTQKYPSLNLKIGKYNLSGDEKGIKSSYNSIKDKYISSVTKSNVDKLSQKLNIIPISVYIGFVRQGHGIVCSIYIVFKYKDTPIIIARKETKSRGAGQTYLISPGAKLKLQKYLDLTKEQILQALKIEA